VLVQNGLDIFERVSGECRDLRYRRIRKREPNYRRAAQVVERESLYASLHAQLFPRGAEPIRSPWASVRIGEYLSADAICGFEYRLEMFACGDGDGAPASSGVGL
jgi:hypothetical protein